MAHSRSVHDEFKRQLWEQGSFPTRFTRQHSRESSLVSRPHVSGISRLVYSNRWVTPRAVLSSGAIPSAAVRRPHRDSSPPMHSPATVLRTICGRQHQRQGYRIDASRRAVNPHGQPCSRQYTHPGLFQSRLLIPCGARTGTALSPRPVRRNRRSYAGTADGAASPSWEG